MFPKSIHIPSVPAESIPGNFLCDQYLSLANRIRPKGDALVCMHVQGVAWAAFYRDTHTAQLTTSSAGTSRATNGVCVCKATHPCIVGYFSGVPMPEKNMVTLVPESCVAR